MKTIVIQATFENASNWSNHWGTDALLNQCIESVKNWAKINSFDYKHYEEPVHPLTTLVSEESYKLPYHKLFLLDQPDYDRVVWIDNDVLVEGNPVIDASPFCIYEYPSDYKTQYNLWTNCGVMWGTRDFLKGLHSYVIAQEDINTRDIFLEYQRMSYLLKDHKYFPGSSDGTVFDETVIQQYLRSKALNINRIHNCIMLGINPLPIDYNFFVHFEGKFKLFQYEMYNVLRSSRNNNYLNTMMQNMLLYSRFLSQEPVLEPHEKRIK